ncbi:efflux RND transporter periplasmic adaptor subunit [Pedobacter sp. HDW13]|uniref:efflux RND transporter periplasmic adaptor subunit n=1 Tax=Pedobacter sp. HDW13 TaxID=2714940 RepID=UPI00140B1E34|nr:efflux RND transporter periplasmic adaptor subunit [Pedobacter sp. HDW13]QIL39826.1 efflux RND transporter periplasmic adaptor subunit [Pedobacter sp. HDW13]
MKKVIKVLNRISCIAVLAISLSSCGNKEKDAAATEIQADSTAAESNAVELTASQYKAVGIALGSPELRSLSGMLKVNGFIDVPPQNLISITTQMGGIVKSTPLLQGIKVSKGQVIAILQNQEYVQLQQDYLESKSQLELTDAEYKRQLTLAQQNVNAQKTLQQAKAAYQGNLARVSALKARLQLININPSSLNAGNIRSQINIYAPITGYVTKVNVNTGKFVAPNDVMFEIVNSANLHVELNVFEKDAQMVKKGQKVIFSLTNDSTQRSAVVQLVGGEINADKTVTVHAIAQGSTAFIPGTYLKAFIETGSVKVMTLPVAAVVDFEGKKYIFVKNEADNKGKTAQNQNQGAENTGPSYHFEMVAVSAGISEGGYLEVNMPAGRDFSGKVVLKGTYDLLSKMKNSEEE